MQMFASVSLLLLASVVVAIGREPEQRRCSNQQFYFEPGASCKNCSDLEQMFDNYSKWLSHLDDQSHVAGSLSSNATSDSSLAKSDSSNNKSVHVEEVSIFKSSPRSGYHNGGDALDVALSRLISLEDNGSSQDQYQEQDRDEYPESSSESASAYLDSSSYSSDSSLDFIRGQTKQVTKFVSQFIRSQRTIGDDLFRVINECRQHQKASACQMWSNVCVMTMYAHSDATSPSNQGKHHYGNGNHAQMSSGSAGHDHHQQQSWRRKGLSGGGWQQCKQLTLASICNSLRDWHRQERKSAGVDNALQSIYATIDEPFSSPIGGSTSGALPAPGLVLRPNQPVQLLAYSYSFEGNLIAVDQFGPSEMEKFCLRSSNLWRLRQHQQQQQQQQQQQRRRQAPLMKGQTDYFRFGKNMKLAGCRLSEVEAIQLLREQQLNDTQFVDLYVAYQAGGSMLLKPVPILVKNLLYNGNLINQKYSKDSSRWRLVHRFFYHSLITTSSVDLQSEQTGSDRQSRGGGGGPSEQEDGGDTGDNHQLNLLYAKSVALYLKFRKLDKGALLSSILLTIDYGFVSRSLGELASASLAPPTATTTTTTTTTARPQNNKSALVSPPMDDYQLETELLVEQSLIDMQAYKKDLDLAITILSILSSIWSLIKCYNIQKCCGNVKLDLESLVRFVIIGCDTVALLLLAVIFIFITYLFVLLKFHHSDVQVLAPNEQLEASLMLNLQLAFVFKLIGLAHKFYVHLNADIFFIDWERPRMLTSSQILNYGYQQQQQVDEHAISKLEPAKPLFSNQHQHQQQQQQQQQQVSFWRPYTVINRWFHMQTLRRLDLTVQLMSFVLLLHLTRATQLASADLSLNVSSSDDKVDSARQLTSRQSLVFRALILAYIYLGLAACQILYKKYLYEPWMRDPVREFVDLCSVANVSLLCWLYPRFGYYIHGRNANGSGDRGIGEMNALLEREERDLCSKRGLAPNSDQQTFILILPKVINDHYRSLLSKETTSFVSKLSTVASSQLLGKQLLFNSNQPTTANNGQASSSNSLLRSALNLSASSASLSGSSPALPLAAAGAGLAFSCRSRIDSLMTKHKSIQQFLTNFLEHVYKDIDYAIREGRRFENLLLLDFDFDDEALISLPGGGTRSPAPQSTNLATQPILDNQQQAQHQRHQAATFCKDRQNSFTSLLWFGLELDLVLIELLSFLVLDFWLGQATPLITASLVWFMHHAFKAIYISCSRYNLITKALVDEKFLFTS